MTEPLPDPLPPPLAALIAAERDRPPPAAEIGEEVLRGITDALARGAPASGGAGVPPSGAAPAPLSSGEAALPGVSASIGIARAAAAAGMTFALGVAFGALLHARLGEPVVVHQAVSRSAVVVVTSADTAPAPTPPEPAPAHVPPPSVPPPRVGLAPSTASKQAAPAPTQAASRAAGHGDTLAAERSLLDRSRSALSRKDAASALAALERHEAQFADGQLVEEREVLVLQALVRAGRAAEARERGARFRQRFPSSLLMPVVDQVLASIP